MFDPASEPDHPRPLNLRLPALLRLHPRLMVVLFGTERHEALSDRAVMKEHRRQPVAAGW